MQRLNESLTARFERPVLTWIASRLPAWVTSDMLTGFGVAGAALTFVGYWQSGQGPALLWLAILGVVMNWFGDSLDGSLARLRKTERPRYGFFLDHMTDTFAMALITIGAGLSPHVHLVVGMAVLVGYYALMILSMVRSHATGVLHLAFNGLGPTEIRIFTIIATLGAILLPIPRFTWQGLEFTVYDGLLSVLSVVIVVMCLFDTFQTLRKLAVEDPPRR